MNTNKNIPKDIEELENEEWFYSLDYVLQQWGPDYRDWETDRKSTRLNSSHSGESRMPSSA